MAKMSKWSLAAVMAAVMGFVFLAAAPASAQSAADVWKKVEAQWESVKSYECTLFNYGFTTPSFIKNFPEHVDKDTKPGWGYRVFKIKFKKPDNVILEYRESLNEDMNDPDMIDSAIAYVLTYVPGTKFMYGQKDTKRIYIVFPYISDSKFKELPIPDTKKGQMKLLMVASRTEVYHEDPNTLKDNRGNKLSETSIGLKIKQYKHYLTDGKITVDKVKLPKKGDFKLNKKTGDLTFKAGTGPEAIRLTMVPKDVKKNRGITKAEVYVDPKTYMISGLTEYEGAKLVQVQMFEDLKLNPSLPDSLWTDLWKGRKLSNTR
jgi:outer membrane lipoprotein-sorting protein